MAARVKIIILEKLGGNQAFKVALWVDVPATRQAFYANAGKVSAWKDAQAGDTTALQNGGVAEFVHTYQGDGVTLGQAQAALQAIWQGYQDKVTSDNPWLRYGTTWDGTSWAVGGVS